MKLSPLDIKKKKIIQNIRTLLNDYPTTHPLAHKIFVNSNYRVLYDLHLNLLAVDGLEHKRNYGKSKVSLPTDSPKSQRLMTNFQDEVNSHKLEHINQALERAQRLSQRRKAMEEDEKNREVKSKRNTWRKKLRNNDPNDPNDPLLALALEIL